MLAFATSASAATWAVRFDVPAGSGETVERTSTGGFVTASVNQVPPGILVVALEANGSPAWQQFLAPSGDIVRSAPILRSSGDGGYFVAATVAEIGHPQSAWLAKLDAVGGILWQRTSSAPEGSVQGPDVIRLGDGGCLLVTIIGSSDSSKLWVMRVDAVGGTVWSKTLDAPGNDLGARAIELPGGDLVLAGAAYRSGTNAGGLVVRLGSDGSVRWQRAVEGPAGVELFAVAGTSTGEILAAGKIGNRGRSGQSGALLVRLSAQGGLNGSRVIRGPYQFNGVVSDSDGRIGLAGQSFKDDDFDDGLIVVTDAAGAPIAASTHGGAGRNGLEAIALDGEGGYVVSGFGSEDPAAGPFPLVERIDAAGLIGSGCPWSVPTSVDLDARPLVVRTTSVVVAPFVPAPSPLGFSSGSIAPVPQHSVCSVP